MPHAPRDTDIMPFAVTSLLSSSRRVDWWSWRGVGGMGREETTFWYSFLCYSGTHYHVCLFDFFSFKLKTIATFSYEVWGHIYLFFFFFIKISWMLWALLSDTLPGTHYFCLHDFFFFFTENGCKIFLFGLGTYLPFFFIKISWMSQALLSDTLLCVIQGRITLFVYLIFYLFKLKTLAIFSFVVWGYIYLFFLLH